MGGMNEGLIREAKNDLITKHPVNDGEALVNFTIDINTKYFMMGMVILKEVIVSADIIKYQ